MLTHITSAHQQEGWGTQGTTAATLQGWGSARGSRRRSPARCPSRSTSSGPRPHPHPKGRWAHSWEVPDREVELTGRNKLPTHHPASGGGLPGISQPRAEPSPCGGHSSPGPASEALVRRVLRVGLGSRRGPGVTSTPRSERVIALSGSHAPPSLPPHYQEGDQLEPGRVFPKMALEERCFSQGLACRGGAPGTGTGSGWPCRTR